MKQKPKVELLKEECIRQCQRFQIWDKQQKYSTFHSSHYDWWAFPVDQPSSYGEKYMITPLVRSQLIQDQEFINALRTNAILVCRAWGYNLQTGQDIASKKGEQRWQRWPIRLYKMANSLQIFEQWDLHKNSVIFAMWLIKKGENFQYLRRKLDGYFIEWENNYFREQKEVERQGDKKQQPQMWIKSSNLEYKKEMGEGQYKMGFKSVLKNQQVRAENGNRKDAKSMVKQNHPKSNQNYFQKQSSLAINQRTSTIPQFRYWKNTAQSKRGDK